MEPVDVFLSKMTDIFETKEKIIDILFICIQHLVIKPRYHMISLLIILCEKMFQEKYDKNKIDDFIMKSRKLIMNVNNKDFTILHYKRDNNLTIVKIPKYIKVIFLEHN
jgi:hypothetical protein